MLLSAFISDLLRSWGGTGFSLEWYSLGSLWKLSYPYPWRGGPQRALCLPAVLFKLIWRLVRIARAFLSAAPKALICFAVLSRSLYVLFHLLYCAWLSQGVRWILVCPLEDLMFMSTETVSRAISRRSTDPLMLLLTHLQSTSWLHIEASAGNKASIIY